MFWAAGNAVSPLVKAMRIPVDRAGRALVLPDLTVPDHPNVYVIGDAAAAPLHDSKRRRRDGPQGPEYVPALAAAANQVGLLAARMIHRTSRAGAGFQPGYAGWCCENPARSTNVRPT